MAHGAGNSRPGTDLRRLGHRRELEEWFAAGMPEHKPAGSRLCKLGHWNLDYETPG
jgi:hypothetical protein|tara:strand:- start:365 stop:532 length:168 start_codon:yes stop_codon:yes gene_type:complete